MSCEATKNQKQKQKQNKKFLYHHCYCGYDNHSVFIHSVDVANDNNDDGQWL